MKIVLFVAVAAVLVVGTTAHDGSGPYDCCFAAGSAYSFFQNLTDPTGFGYEFQQVDPASQQFYRIHSTELKRVLYKVEEYLFKKDNQWYQAVVDNGGVCTVRNISTQPDAFKGYCMNGLNPPTSVSKVRVGTITVDQFDWIQVPVVRINTTMIWDRSACLPIAIRFWDEVQSIQSRLDFYNVKDSIVDPALFILPSKCKMLLEDANYKPQTAPMPRASFFPPGFGLY